MAVHEMLVVSLLMALPIALGALDFLFGLRPYIAFFPQAASPSNDPFLFRIRFKVEPFHFSQRWVRISVYHDMCFVYPVPNYTVEILYLGRRSTIWTGCPSTPPQDMAALDELTPIAFPETPPGS